MFPRLVAARQLRSIKLSDEFIDIGVPEDYIKFCDWMDLRGKNES